MISWPTFGRGQRIGLFGGSFNPAHQGHRAVALYALKRLKLDWVWWMVAQQNPLKNVLEYDDYERRLAQTRQIARHPRFVVTDIERQIGSRNTAATLRAMAPVMRKAEFVWIMGADSFASLHRWHDWTEIAEALPLAFLARPGYSIRALNGVAAHRYGRCRIPTSEAARLPELSTPAWVFVPMPLRKESSSAIRKKRRPSAVKETFLVDDR